MRKKKKLESFAGRGESGSRQGAGYRSITAGGSKSGGGEE